MAVPLVARILDAYGIAYLKIHEPQKGYRNQSFCVTTKQGKLNVILYKIEPGMAERVKRTNAVGDFLAGRQLPARQTFSAKILAAKGISATKFAAIYHYLPGNTIPWEAYTMRRIKMLGKVMGDMHAALRTGAFPLPLVNNELTALYTRMQRYFADPHTTKALRQKLGVFVVLPDFSKILQSAASLPSQPLHMDFVRGNILFNGDSITGILDFEKAARGAPVYDIARTLAFLLVDCKYKPPAKIRKYFLLSGYAKRGGQPLPNATLLESLTTFFLWHDFYKFLRHNPYEYLPQNEHFMRTKVILLQRGVIRVK